MVANCLGYVPKGNGQMFICLSFAIFSKDWNSHLPKVQAVLDSLSRGGFTMNPEKCTVGMEVARYSTSSTLWEES